jgi:hypothetical protein
MEMMMLSLSGALLAAQLTLSVADQVPKLDVVPGCRGAAVMGMGATLQNCVAAEENAQQQLAKEWAHFPRSDKASCTQEVGGFEPSYVELLTCLEVARDAKQVPHE